MRYRVLVTKRVSYAIEAASADAAQALALMAAMGAAADETRGRVETRWKAIEAERPELDTPPAAGVE